MSSSRRSFRIAAVASLAIHLAVFAWLAHQKAPKPVEDHPVPAPLAIELRYLPPEPAAPAPKPPAPARAHPSRSKRRTAASPAIAAPTRPTSDAPVVSIPADAPRKLDWSLPLPAGTDATELAFSTEDAGNPEDDEPPEVRIPRRVNQMLREDMGRYHVQKGLVDARYSDLRRALDRDFEALPKAKGNFWTAGVPVPEWKDSRAPPEQLLPRSSAMLLAVIQLEHSPQGKLLSVKLRRSSGNAAFDSLVLETPKHSATLFEDSKVDLQHRHSVWAMEGRTVLFRKFRGFDNPADVLTLLAAIPTTGIGIDPTQGVYIPDFFEPKLTCTARLLEVF